MLIINLLIDVYYSENCEALHCSSLDFIPSSKSSDSCNYIVPGFNKYVNDSAYNLQCSDIATYKLLPLVMGDKLYS